MKKGNALFYSALLLTGAHLLLRLVSMGFQVYLSGRIGAAGIGLLQLVLSVNGLFFTAGSAGNRTCAAYLTAEKLGQGKSREIRPLMGGCFCYSLVCGAAAAMCLWRFAPWLAENWIGNRAAVSSLRLCALCLPVKCLHGVLTGYLTSAGRIRTLVAVSFLEQGCVIAATFLLLSRRMGGQGWACFSVVAGSCAGALASFCILLALYARSLPLRETADRRPPYRQILRSAVPLALADDLRSGLNTVENLIIPKRLALYTGTVDALADYGAVCGMVFPVLMFSAAILSSLAELLVPELSLCAAGGRQRRVRYLVRRSFRIALLFGLAVGGTIFSASEALGELLYHDRTVGEYLRLYAPLVPMLYTDAIVDAMCKGLGQHNANARYNTLTCFLDVAGLWFLLPRLGLGGYYFSFAATHLINFGLSLRRLILASGVRLELGRALRATLCAGFAAAVAALLPKWEGIMGAVRPGMLYLVVLGLTWALFRVVDREDVSWLRGLVGGRERRTARTGRAIPAN